MSYPFGHFNPTKPITFDEMLNTLKECGSTLPDNRKGKNLTYQDPNDFLLSAFSVFFLQHPSFLSQQQEMENIQGNNNARTIFGLEKIPTDNHIRNMLDDAEPKLLDPVYNYLFQRGKQQGVIEEMRSDFERQLLIAFDGTYFHESHNISCSGCSTQEHKNGSISYQHSAVTPVLVKPDCPEVFNLPPEFVTKQDGHKKQDCEIEASKRWLKQHGSNYSELSVTILGDDLYCHQPFCEEVLAGGFNFLFNCKPKSHKTTYDWIEGLEKIGAVEKLEIKRWTGKKHVIDTYRFAADIPLRDSDDALKVNWFELTTTTEEGKIIYKNAFATNHRIHKDNVVEAVRAGRSRWKIENENNNTLKTKGYHLEHNFGHGKKHLANFLASLNMLAFLMHTTLDVFCKTYQGLRKQLGRRVKFFEHIRTLTQYICFKSWSQLLVFMVERLKTPIKCEILDTG